MCVRIAPRTHCLRGATAAQPPCKRKEAGSAPAGGSRWPSLVARGLAMAVDRVQVTSLAPCRSSPTGRGVRLRPGRFAVRIRGSAPGRVNQAGPWASLLTSARLRPWRSSRPLSALEDEPGGSRLRLETGRSRRRWDSSSPSSGREAEPGRVPAPPRKRAGA